MLLSCFLAAEAGSVVYNAAVGALVGHWQLASALLWELLAQKLGSATSGGGLGFSV